MLQEIELRAAARQLSGLSALRSAGAAIGNQGAGNSGWIGRLQGRADVVRAARRHRALALACSANFAATSCGYVGVNDGWQQLNAHRRLTECYARAYGRQHRAHRARSISSAVMGGSCSRWRSAPTPAEAAQDARAALLRDFDDVRDSVRRAGGRASTAVVDRAGHHERRSADGRIRLSVAMLRTHEDKGHPGGMIASLSIPWGNAKGDHDLGGYHVVVAARSRRERGRAARRRARRRRAPRASLSDGARRRRTAIGRRTCGSTERPTGAAIRWTRRGFRFCSPTIFAGMTR